MWKRRSNGQQVSRRFEALVNDLRTVPEEQQRRRIARERKGEHLHVCILFSPFP